MSISNLLQPNSLGLYCGSITQSNDLNQFINLPAAIFDIPVNTAVPFTPNMGIYLPVATKQPTSITFFYKDNGGGASSCFVEIRSISNVPIIYYQDSIPTASNPAKVLTQLIPLPLTSNLLMIGFTANSAGAGSLFPISLHISYD
jgi:hypothetical protein